MKGVNPLNVHILTNNGLLEFIQLMSAFLIPEMPREHVHSMQFEKNYNSKIDWIKHFLEISQNSS